MASSSNSQWHSINPQTRPLTLSILELTPLALTLSLTLAPQTSPSTPFNIQSHGASHHVAHTHNHAHGPTPSKHKKKPRHRRPDSDDEAIAVDLDDDHLSSPVPGTHPSGGALDHTTNFKDLLSHGVVVSVNGQPWNRIVAHVSDPDEELADGEQEDVEPNEGEDDWEDDAEQVGEEGPSTGITRRRPRRARFGASAGNAVKAEEGKDTPRRRTKPATAKQHDKMVKDQAVVVVYGLTPGKEYDIELQVVGLSGSDGMDAVLSQSIMVPASPSPALPRSRANSLRARSIPRSRSNSATGVHPSTQDLFLGNSSGGNTPPATDTPPAPIPTNILNPVDTQAAQIRHMIAAAHAEKDLVQNQIKEARRAAQRAEAALKVEIESVKKATEKAGSMDLRAKQKALALQEQVKQGWTGAEHAEAEAAEVDQGMHELEDKLESAKIEVETVKAEWLSIKKSEDESKEVDRKTRSEEEKKLAEVVSKVDKLRAKKEKKEAEKAELERKLEDLERQRLEVERRNEEDRNNKRTSGFWFDPYQNHAQANHNHAPHNRTLTNHPSLTNLSAGQGFRPRGGFQGRFASAGAPRTGPSQPSPTHANTFYTSQHPAPSSSPGPTFRPPKAMVGSPSANTRSNSTPGVNVSAMPFHPSNMDSAQQHTTLMPPQLQHRIYLPNVRPRPTPNFNPPPSVMAEQAQRQSPTMLSAPSFPPLPGQAGQTGGNKQTSGGPSLASIVTRAVLSPTALAAQENAVARLSPPPMRSNLYSAQNPSGGNTLPTSPPTKSSTQNAVGQSNPASRQNTLAQQQPERVGEFPPLSPTGPWGMVRMATPPVSGWNAQGRESPSSSGGGTGSAQTSRRGTVDA